MLCMLYREKSNTYGTISNNLYNVTKKEKEKKNDFTVLRAAINRLSFFR